MVGLIHRHLEDDSLDGAAFATLGHSAGRLASQTVSRAGADSPWAASACPASDGRRPLRASIAAHDPSHSASAAAAPARAAVIEESELGGE